MQSDLKKKSPLLLTSGLRATLIICEHPTLQYTYTGKWFTFIILVTNENTGMIIYSIMLYVLWGNFVRFHSGMAISLFDTTLTFKILFFMKNHKVNTLLMYFKDHICVGIQFIDHLFS